MAGHLIVRSGCLWRFEHHHGQRRTDFRGPVFVPKHRESRRLPRLAVQSGREALQNGQSWVRRERDRRHVWQTGEVEHRRVGDDYRRRGLVRYRPMLLEDHSGARWCGIRLGRHPTAVRRGVGGFRVTKHLHLPVAHDKQAETAGWERDDAHVGERAERFWDGLQRRRVVLLSTAGELDVAVDRDDASDATQSEAVVRVWRLPCLGYGKLSSWDRIAERAHATLIAACSSHVRASDDSFGFDDEHSRRLPVRHAHHSIDLDRRP